ncbi:Spindle assembly abnormal protein 6 homolog [Durusdinium trenchii]|uniref:Spindle assembly abnormal protein 6 homolog n=1 Tax=Durusdinium trenchii TaxID=1381693 RepID=A0ABP0L1B1_9DINO
MGNAAPSVSRVLELRLARPTWHQGDLSRHLELRPWPAPLFSAPAPPLRPRWEETFRMEVEMGLEVRVMQGEQELARGVLEAIPPVPQLVFRVVPLPLAPSSFGTLEVKLREAPSEQGEEGRFQFQMPLARRQVISLELQNAELLKRLKGRASRDGRRTELTERERAPMRHQQLLAEAYAQTAELLQKKQHLRRRLAAMKLLCHSELPRLRGQLQQALARQQQLKADAEAKIASLQERLRHAQEKGLSEVEVQGLVALALGRREELQRKLREEAEAQASQESPEVAHLQELSLQQQEDEGFCVADARRWGERGSMRSDMEEEESPHTFSEKVCVLIKPLGRDHYTSPLSIRLWADNPAHPRSLLLELTDEKDLLFYHSLALGESDFHALRSEQRLLVDFQSFPEQLADLLRRCSEAEWESSAASAGGRAKQEPGSSKMLASLECTASGESRLNIVESTNFRELIHIDLRLRQGSDEVVKKHLAKKLRICRAELLEKERRLGHQSEALESSKKQAGSMRGCCVDGSKENRPGGGLKDVA